MSCQPFGETTPENTEEVGQAFTKSSQKPKQKALSELGVERASLGRRMYCTGF